METFKDFDDRLQSDDGCGGRNTDAKSRSANVNPKHEAKESKKKRRERKKEETRRKKKEKNKKIFFKNIRFSSFQQPQRGRRAFK
jgi:hypothetical protein